MAVPRINRIYGYGDDIDGPARGPSGGGVLVVVTGDNFLAPSRGGHPTRSVEVWFGTARSPLVRVLRGNMLHATTPPSPLSPQAGGEGAVDVTVRNLDLDGVPIPGEEVVLQAGYVYHLPRLDAEAEQRLAEVERALLHFFKLRVCKNTLTTQSVEFDADGVGLVPEIAELPSLVLSGPEPEASPFRRERRVVDTIEDDEGRVAVMRYTTVVNLTYRVTGQASGKMGMLNLMNAFIDVVERAREVRIPTDTGEIRMDLSFPAGGMPRPDVRPSDSDLHSFTASIRLTNVMILGTRPVTGSEVGVAVPPVRGIRIGVEPL